MQFLQIITIKNDLWNKLISIPNVLLLKAHSKSGIDVEVIVSWLLGVRRVAWASGCPLMQNSLGLER